jgi:hypothetical protein
MRANALGCPNGSPWLNAAQRRGAGWPDLRAATGSNGQPAGNQGAACNTLKRRDFWQPGGTGGLILSYEKKEGMGGRERRKRWSVGAKAARLARAARNPKKSMARAGTGGRLAGGIGGGAHQPGRVAPIATAMVMGSMAWRCIRWGVKPHLVLHTPQAVPWWRC